MIDILNHVPGWAFFVIPCLGITAWNAASVLYRKNRGKPIWPKDPPHFVVQEKGVSGYCHRSWYTKLGGARNVLVVTLTDQVLIIRPRFPFNLMFMPEIYGLEHEILLGCIENMERHRHWGRDMVAITFKDKHEQAECISLHLRRPDDLLQALAICLQRITGAGQEIALKFMYSAR